MEHRKAVFQAKVLRKLYPASSKVETKPSSPHIVEVLAKKTADKKKASPGTGPGDGGIAPYVPHGRVYTVLPPPPECQPGAGGSSGTPHPVSINSTQDTGDGNTKESSGEEEDEDEEEDGSQDREQAKRRRKRRRKKKSTSEALQQCSVTDEGQAVDSNGTPIDGQPFPTGVANEGERLSKNRKRKLKKKRHKEKLFALGLAPKATALEFTYQTQGEEEEQEMKELRAVEVSDFLRTTMELYESESTLPVDRSPLPSTALDDLLIRMDSGRAPPTALRQLDSLVALVKQKDTAGLTQTLQDLHNDSPMSPEETAAVVTLCRYWITDILPLQKEMQTRR